MIWYAIGWQKIAKSSTNNFKSYKKNLSMAICQENEKSFKIKVPFITPFRFEPNLHRFLVFILNWFVSRFSSTIIKSLSLIKLCFQNKMYCHIRNRCTKEQSLLFELLVGHLLRLRTFTHRTFFHPRVRNMYWVTI